MPVLANVPMVVPSNFSVSGQAAGQPGWSWTPAELSIADASGVVRAEMGTLQAKGVSPAQFGFRASDQDGPFFDSLGLFRGVMQLIGGTPVVSGDLFTNLGPPYVESTLITATFTLPRNLHVLMMCQAEYFMAAAGQTGNLAFMIDGVIPAPYTPIDIGIGGTATQRQQVTFIWSDLLTGGTSHRISLAGQQTSGGGAATEVGNAVLLIFQLGN